MHTTSLEAGCLDKTGVGEVPYEEISNFMPRINGITLTVQTKEDIMGNLRLTMEHQNIIIPRDNQRLLSQLTSQQTKPLSDGKLQFSHPSGTKDDLLWAVALGYYAVRNAPAPLGYISL